MNRRSSSSAFNDPLVLPPLASMRHLSTPGPVTGEGASSAAITDNPAKRRRLPPGPSIDPPLVRGPLPSDSRQPEPRPRSWTWTGRAPWIDSDETTSRHKNDFGNASIPAHEAMSTSNPGGPKGPRIIPAAAMPSPYVRRKRAVAACQFCRERKTKCDNERPVCGYCRRHQARCVYADGSQADGLQVGVDEAASRHREVLERLDDIRSLLANHPSPMAHDARSIVASELSSHTSELLNPAPVSSHIGHTFGSTDHRPVESPIEANATHCQSGPPVSGSTSYLQYTKCESILKWPILKAVMTEEDAAIDSFIFDAYVRGDGEASTSTLASAPSWRPHPRTGSTDRQSATSDTPKSGRDQSYVTLCQKFLALVNCRNPIMDAHDLLIYARSVEEAGLEWDAKSCLVLLACALASFSRAWTPPSFIRSSSSKPANDILLRRNSIVPSDVMSTTDDEAAVSYYEAAQRRLGCLGTSLTDIQCFYFASLFEKFAFRPVQSWMHLQQAATRLRLHHMERANEASDLHVGGSDNGETDASQSNISFHFEQRAFWSIHKAEREFATELGITLASDLASFNYPAAFPTPPEMLDQLIASDDSDEEANGSEIPALFSPRRNEFIWFFYLAQISLRRTLDELLALIYAKGEQNWIENIDLFSRQYYESKKQIADWQSHLPATMRYDPSSQPNNEMGYYLEGRFEEWNESILRPLVYYCLHHPAKNPPSPTIVALAQQYMTLCTDCIMRCSTHDRHGGTWFIIRRSFRCTLVILAAVVAEEPLQPPQNWNELSRMTIETLKRWSPGVKDLQRMRRVLERVFNAVCERETGRASREGQAAWSIQ